MRPAGGAPVAVEPDRLDAERAEAPDVAELLGRPRFPGDDDALPLPRDRAQPGAQGTGAAAEETRARLGVLEVEMDEAALLGEEVADGPLAGPRRAEQEERDRCTAAPPAAGIPGIRALDWHRASATANGSTSRWRRRLARPDDGGPRAGVPVLFPRRVRSPLVSQSRSVASEFSDPAWWPKPPPKPPTSVSTMTILFGTIVPVVAVAAVLIALFDHRSHHPAVVQGRSAAAFESCLQDQGALTPSAETNDALLRQAALACRRHVPALAPGGDRVAAAQQALQQCLQAATQHFRSDFAPGRFGGGGARQSFNSATALCRARAFAEPGGGQTEPTPTAIA